MRSTSSSGAPMRIACAALELSREPDNPRDARAAGVAWGERFEAHVDRAPAASV